MVVGRLWLGLQFGGTSLTTAHDVLSNQQEPDLPIERQAAHHSTDLAFMDTTLVGGLPLTRWLALELSLPFRLVRQTTTFRNAKDQALGGFQSIHHRDGTKAGLGDVGLCTRLQLVESGPVQPLRLDVRPGFTLPTGDTVPNPEELGRKGLPHEHVFFGSGTIDPTLGIDAQYGFDGWRLTAFGFGRTSLYSNGLGYRQGLRFGGGMGVDFAVGESWRALVRPEVYHEEPSIWASDQAEGTGRTDFIATAGLTWLPAPQWSASLTVKVPLRTWSVGGQVELPLLAMLQVTRSIDLFAPAGAP